MEISVRTGDVLAEATDLGVLAVFDGAALPDALADLLEAADFTGAAKQTRLLYPRGAVAPRRLLLIGLGKADSLDAEGLRDVGALATKEARGLQVSSFALGLPADLGVDAATTGQAIAEGLLLGGYSYLHYRTGLTEAQTFTVSSASVLVAADESEVAAGAAAGGVIARGVAFARDLVNRPGADKTPPQLADEAVKLGERASAISVTVFDKPELEKQGFGGILAVGKGSDADPRFIIMEYGTQYSDGPTICLVGKGLTFDSGGLSIKPADAMETMKNDMGGSATVFGTMQVVAELGLPLHIVGLVSSAENMPSGRSYRPGDVVTTLSGKTIEVLNTDAEGRVILSDALFYAQRYEPDAIIEFSTLTGAVIVALGAHASGLMATDQSLADDLRAAGDSSGDRVWQLPLWQPYHDMVKSEIADLKNLAGRAAGSITAGAFLAAFVGDNRFAHVDIAGTAWVDKPRAAYESAGGTGSGVRLMAEYLRTRAS